MSAPARRELRTAATASPSTGPGRIVVIGFGWTCVGLATLGIVLPVLPTTPFLLLALWAFARTSRPFRDWLLGHPVFGPRVRDWHDHGVIPRRAKAAALGCMTASLGYLVLGTNAPPAGIGATAGLMAAGAVYVLSRPSEPKDTRAARPRPPH